MREDTFIKQRSARQKSQPSGDSAIYMQRGPLPQTDEIRDLMLVMLVVFQGKPLLLPKQHSVSLETKWHVEACSASVVTKKEN